MLYILVGLLAFYLIDAVFFFFMLRSAVKKLNTSMCIYYSMVLALLWPWQIGKLNDLMKKIQK